MELIHFKIKIYIFIVVNIVANPISFLKTMILEIDLFRVFISDDNNLDISINKWFIIISALLLLLWFLLRLKKWKAFKSIEIDAVELGIGNQKVTLKRDITDRQIAYKLWVELSTRKIGVAIDLEHDVIVELYNSWYRFFGTARDLIKEIPASKLKRAHTRDIAELAIKVLNAGVRPHLTRWQARFRRWYDHEAKNNPDLMPQDIQKNYPHYEELTADMMVVNRQLIVYRNKMYELAMGRSPDEAAA